MSVKGFFGNLLRNIRGIRSSGSNWNNMNDWYYLKSLDFKRRMLIARHLTGAIARRLSGFAVEGLSGFIFSTGGGTHGPEKVSAKSEDEPVREGIAEMEGEEGDTGRSSRAARYRGEDVSPLHSPIQGRRHRRSFGQAAGSALPQPGPAGGGPGEGECTASVGSGGGKLGR